MQINNKIFHSCRTLDESRLSPDFIDFGCWKNILNKMMIKITRLWNRIQVLKIANLFRKLSSRNQFELHFSSALTAFHTFFLHPKKSPWIVWKSVNINTWRHSSCVSITFVALFFAKLPFVVAPSLLLHFSMLTRSFRFINILFVVDLRKKSRSIWYTACVCR